MAFSLLHDRVAVIGDEIPETTESGLILTGDAGQSPLRYGTVAVVGRGTRSVTGEVVPVDVKEGDRVFFNRYSGQPLEIDDVEYVILGNGEIIGVDVV